jgi:ribosomal protein S18 acetylase RimI-like enzyme
MRPFGVISELADGDDIPLDGPIRRSVELHDHAAGPDRGQRDRAHLQLHRTVAAVPVPHRLQPRAPCGSPNVDPVLGSAPHAGLGHDEYASAVRIEPLPDRLYDAAIRLWQDSGLTRPWNDPEADLRRAAGGGSSCVLAAIGDDDGLLATAMVGHDGHRGWVYYLAVDAAQRGRGLGRQMMEACEDWVRSRGIPKIQLMVRATNRGTIGFYEHLGYADSEVVVLGHRLGG